MSVGNSECIESAPLLEVFRVFLSTNNTLVFSNAALDCILCLLKHVKGSYISHDSRQYSVQEEEIPSTPTNISANKNDSFPDSTETKWTNLCVESLKHLLNCSEILASMYKMPACPIFQSVQRIQLLNVPQYVDPNIPNIDAAKRYEWCKRTFDLIRNGENGEDDRSKAVAAIKKHSCLEATTMNNFQTVTSTLQSMDNPSGILKVWFLLIEGLASATMICPKKYQPHTLEALFHILRNTLVVPGPLFGLYCINHLLLPMVQNWLRKTSSIFRGWDNFASNFKQCCGLTTDLVVDFIAQLQGTFFSK